MRRWRNLLIGGFLLTFVLLLGSFNATKPRILVLHSYSRDSHWVAEVDRGIREALERNRRPISVEWNYMGLGSPASPRRAEVSAAEARRAIGRIKPDVLIAVDDEANALVASGYVDRSEPRILYVSIDRPPAEYGYADAANVSGISETLAWKAMRDTIVHLYPGRPATLAVLGVDSVSDRAELAQLKAFDWGAVAIGRTTLVSTADEWRDVVRDSASADVLLVLGAQDLVDRTGTVVAAAELSRWTEESSRPLPIGVQGDFVAHGGGLAFEPPADDYGQSAVRLALDWLDERSTPGPPAPVESSHFGVAVRPEALARRGVTLPQIYLEAARENGTLFS